MFPLHLSVKCLACCYKERQGEALFPKLQLVPYYVKQCGVDLLYQRVFGAGQALGFSLEGGGTAF